VHSAPRATQALRPCSRWQRHWACACTRKTGADCRSVRYAERPKIFSLHLFPKREQRIHSAPMAMKIVGTSRLDEFCLKHPLTRSWVKTWLAESRAAVWGTSFDIKKRHSSASFLQNNVVIFNVKGNEYRLVTQVAYKTGVVVVKWIGTHQGYSNINWENVRDETRSS